MERLSMACVALQVGYCNVSGQNKLLYIECRFQDCYINAIIIIIIIINVDRRRNVIVYNV